MCERQRETETEMERRNGEIESLRERKQRDRFPEKL